MATFVKLSSKDITVIEIMFLRSFFSLLVLIVIFKLKYFTIRKTNLKFHALRTILGLLAMFLTFTALSAIPLSNVTIISFTKIFFIIPLAFYFFKEKINFYSFIYIFLGFLGVIILVGVDIDSTNNFIYYFCALSGAFFIALVKLLIKKISYYEKNLNIQFWFSFFSCSFLFIPFYFVATLPSLKTLLFITLSAIFGLLAQFFTIEGLRSSKSIVVMPFDYFRVIFSIGLGILVFSEKITLPIVIGFFIIFFSSLRLLKTAKDK
jgi:drug/metabolite transporter (DMT)-like permease